VHLNIFRGQESANDSSKEAAAQETDRVDIPACSTTLISKG
jgi:hypothetical protein